ncbi:hypothetical protein AWH48_16020 [Domibacillus aminovorans]|uniref:Uncharacterized protein n=1 Tax=Domibacillus aminovorans TaxID=29332 RepID=A0A177L1P4_9BACI|nr:hypothetical protein [Domibacillus aminovorans]OAH59247.1 hypothetical protein AWH48_16020 [Domibacillus aminovorans]
MVNFIKTQKKHRFARCFFSMPAYSVLVVVEKKEHQVKRGKILIYQGFILSVRNVKLKKDIEPSVQFEYISSPIF